MTDTGQPKIYGQIDPDTAKLLATLWKGTTPPKTILGEPTTALATTQWGVPTPEGKSNPYWDIVRQLPNDKLAWRGPSVDSYARYHNGASFPITRDDLTFHFAYAIPSPGDIAFLIDHLGGQPVIELGAGTGYWAWQLSQHNIDIVTYDNKSWTDLSRLSSVEYHPILQGSTEQIPLHPTRILMLCWPTYSDPFAYDALTAYAGNLFIYIGEGPGGCTGDDKFDDLLAEHWTQTASSPHHVNYFGIHSDVGIYTRNTPTTHEDTLTKIGNP